MSKKNIGKAIVVTIILSFCLIGSIGVNAAEFTDTNHWAKNSIDYSVEQGWFVGTSSTKFSPDTDMTRGMFVTVLARYAGADTSDISSSSGFSDVAPDEYYASSVEWAYANGIVVGASENTFGPDDVITREEASVIFNSYVKSHNISLAEKNATSVYADDASIASWSHEAVYEMQKYGIIVGGSNNKFYPQNGLKRAEAAAVFCRLNGQFFDKYDVVVTPPVEDKGTLKGTFKSTFYCPGSCCNGSWSGQTALGVTPTPGRTIAVDPSVIPLGSYVTLEFTNPALQQYNGTYRAEDTGGAIKGYRIDVLLSSHAACNAAGVGQVNVYVK